MGNIHPTWFRGRESNESNPIPRQHGIPGWIEPGGGGGETAPPINT